MSTQTVPFSSLEPPAANPRSFIDPERLKGLAASIKADGLLQNLIVAPAKGKNRFRVVGGERRFRALGLLFEGGEITGDYEVPVNIQTGLDAGGRLRIATVENVQREQLPPLDEAAAFAAMIRKGTTLETLESQTGLSTKTIRRRLALNGLCKQVRAALTENRINLAQAEAFTLGTHDAQRNVLEQIAENPETYSAHDIREGLLEDRPSVAMAIFPLERYTGTITTDLFQTEEASYFDDAEQFLALQKQAVEERAATYRQTAAWVEVTELRRIPEWQYEQAEEGEPSGVLINLSPSGEFEIREGLTKPEIDEDTAEETAEHFEVAQKPRPEYGVPLCRYIGAHKSLAVQEVLLANPRKAREVAAVQGLQALEVHVGFRELSGASAQQSACLSLEGQAGLVLSSLGMKREEDQAAWQALTLNKGDDLALYAAVKALTDQDLERLLLMVAVLPFGQAHCDRLDAHESLFNAVARDLDLDMRSHWRADADFLNRRNREQLARIAAECGYADGRSNLQSWKKAELVAGLLKHFDDSRRALEPSEAQRKALAWLPAAMRFPAVESPVDTNPAGEA